MEALPKQRPPGATYTQQEIHLFATLAKTAYHAKTWQETLYLPGSWKKLFYWTPTDGFDNFFALFVDPEHSKVVVAVRGSQSWINFQTNWDLVKGAWNSLPSIFGEAVDSLEPPRGYEALLQLVHSLRYHLHALSRTQEQPGPLMTIQQQLVDELDWETSLLHVAVVTAAYYDTVGPEVNVDQVTRLVAGHVFDNVGNTYKSTAHNLSIDLNGAPKPQSNESVLKNTENISELGEPQLRQTCWPDCLFSLVGHSLGGIMTELCAVELDVKCVTFESPGSLEIIKARPRFDYTDTGMQQGSLDDESDSYGSASLQAGISFPQRPIAERLHNVTGFLAAPNWINTLHGHPGVAFCLFLPHTEGRHSSVAHSLSSVLGNVANMLSSRGPGTAWFLLSHSAAIPAAYSDWAWLLRQHSIDNIVEYLRPNQEAKMARILMWPLAASSATVTNVLGKWLRFIWHSSQDIDLPNCDRGKSEKDMRKARIKLLENYQLEEEEPSSTD